MSYTEVQKHLFRSAVDLKMKEIGTVLHYLHVILADPDTEVMNLENQMDLNAAIVDFCNRAAEIYIKQIEEEKLNGI